MRKSSIWVVSIMGLNLMEWKWVSKIWWKARDIYRAMGEIFGIKSLRLLKIGRYWGEREREGGKLKAVGFTRESVGVDIRNM